jgi:hypothetical protein
MLRSSLQRAAMAILLVGMMIAPLGICLQRTHKGAHSCCMRQSQSSHSLRTNCCAVRAQLPATLVAPTLPGASSSQVVHEYAACVEVTAMDEYSAVEVSPPQSPPIGAFILRI